MCYQYWNRFRFERCGHVEKYEGDTVMCSSAKSRGLECSSKSKSYSTPIDTSGKCSNCT